VVIACAARWPNDGFPEWNGTAEGARDLQARLATQVQLADAGRPRLLTVAGVSAVAIDGGRSVRAAAVLLDAQTLQPLHQNVVECPSRVPYLRSLLDFRILPAMREALAPFQDSADLVLVDGHGIAHPRRLGVASHLGVSSGLPTVGVGRSALHGTHESTDEIAGAHARLRDGDQQIGWVVRTRSGHPPVYASPGHRVSLSGTLELVLRLRTRHRLPEPVHLARRLALPAAPIWKMRRAPSAVHSPMWR